MLCWQGRKLLGVGLESWIQYRITQYYKLCNIYKRLILTMNSVINTLLEINQFPRPPLGPKERPTLGRSWLYTNCLYGKDTRFYGTSAHRHREVGGSTITNSSPNGVSSQIKLNMFKYATRGENCGKFQSTPCWSKKKGDTKINQHWSKIFNFLKKRLNPNPNATKRWESRWLKQLSKVGFESDFRATGHPFLTASISTTWVLVRAARYLI